MQIANCKLPIAECVLSVGRKAEYIANVACFFLLAIATAANAQAFSFDDIHFWVGNGTNRAALAIDWVEGSTEPPALVWGFRWDGTARGRDMLLAIVTADSRLFAKLGGTPANPNAVYGLGYDADNDGQFGIDDDTTFNSSGIAFSGPADGAAAIYPGDHYAEGWITGFWHYGIASTNPYDGGTWADIQFGMASRVLTDGAWDSWTFEGTTVPPFDAYAENPTPAPPPGGRPGDFNNDGFVDADDYDQWRHHFSSPSQPPVDPSGNGTVDAADYAVWRKYAYASDGSFSNSMSAPEPSASWTAPVIVVTSFMASPRRRRSMPNVSKSPQQY
jgi:hypothetical protein